MSNTHTSDDCITEVDGVIGLPSNSTDAMLTQNVCVSAPLPCIVILIHGVNDIGEAFPNLDKGICEGLNKRLGRSDLKPNKWQWAKVDDDDFSPRMQMLTEWEETAKIKPPLKPKVTKHKGNSPVIPFFWGYRPVDVDTYYSEQKAYKARLEKGKPDELPYDAYWIEQETKELAEVCGFSKLNHDHFGNWIDYHFTRNGGPFSDATTCIPDMYGPGLTWLTSSFAKWGSTKGAKAYDNPHRIYMAFAARRLANLIIKIRKDEKLKEAPINIVAHSQGTIITMLANMMLAEEGYLPADCVILAHSPYAFDCTFLESQSKEYGMGVQTNEARKQTFINFVQAIKDGQDLRENKYDDPEILIEKGVAAKTIKDGMLNPSTQDYDFTNPLYCRHNFGKVYNYFCPNDQVVSFRSVEGMGWQGIPNHVFNQCGDNLKQRAFGHRMAVGEDPAKFIFFRPKGAFEIAVPEYLDRKALKDRQIDIIKKYDPENESFSFMYKMYIYLTKDEIALVNQHNPIENGSFVHGYYDNITDKIIIYYKVDDKISAQLEKDEEYGIYSPTETGSISNARYRVREKLNINGERVPEPIIYTGCGKSAKTKLAKAIYYSDLFLDKNKYYQHERLYKESDEYQPYPKYEFYYHYPDRPKKRFGSSSHLLDSTYYYPWPDDRLKEHPEWLPGFSHFRFTDDPHKFEVWCFPSGEELKQKVYKYVQKQTEEAEDSSHHSGITLNEQVPSHIMAFDLALGEVNIFSKENRRTWQQLIHLADWRSPENEDSDTITYKNYGILPTPIKSMMNLLQGKLPDGVINEFNRVESVYEMAFLVGGFDVVKKIAAKQAAQLAVIVGGKVFGFYINPEQQWPLPVPDTERRS
jgi:hypothetical protein